MVSPWMWRKEPIVKLLIGPDTDLKSCGVNQQMNLILIENLKIQKYGIMKDLVDTMFLQIDLVRLHMDQEIV